MSTFEPNAVEKYGTPSSAGFSGGTLTAPVLVPNGSHLAPSYAFTGSDASTGFFRAGANGVGIAASGQTRYTMDANGVFIAHADNANGAYRAANRNASQAAFAFTSDIDTGMYRIGEDNLGFSAGGVKRLSVGTLGIDFSGQTFLSGRTVPSSAITNGASMLSNEILFSFGASGASLVIRSGNTLWVFNSTVSAVASG